MSRRLTNTVTSALLLIGLGFLIAVSARSLPGQEDEEDLAELTLSMPDWVGDAIQWTILVIAVSFGAYLLVSIRRGATWEWSEIKRALSRVGLILVWAGVFFLIYSITRPPEESAPSGSGSLTPDDGGGGLLDIGAPGTSAGWVAIALLLLVATAAAIRVIRAVGSRTGTAGTSPENVDAPLEALADPIPVVQGDDPRSRIINAYAGFESEAQLAGQGRRISETARHHASRAGSVFSSAQKDLQSLSRAYEAARFAGTTVDDDGAEAAEDALRRIKQQIGAQ